jgi:short-subunit dehydrogenase
MVTESNVGKLAVVTGASSGIGFELARQFAENGFDLLVIAEDSGIESAAKKLHQYGTKIQAIQEDLAAHKGVENVYAAIKASGRPVDAIALNAGVGVGGPFIQTDLEKEQNLIDLNVTSTVRLAKYILRDMHIRNQGRVLFTGSVVSEMPGPFQAIYAASTAFV